MTGGGLQVTGGLQLSGPGCRDLENGIRQPAFGEKVWKAAVVSAAGAGERAGQDLP